MRHFFTPWRYRYISGREKRDQGCVFCIASEPGAGIDTLTLHHGIQNIVLMNRFPYSNGHLMISPTFHTASLGQLSPGGRAEMMELVVVCQAILDDLYRPDGFNLGMNLGQSAGAGIADHLHLHVVPRWFGDTNFMTSVADTRLVPETLDDSFARLNERFVSLGLAGARA